jgi:hypothetical protein
MRRDDSQLDVLLPMNGFFNGSNAQDFIMGSIITVFEHSFGHLVVWAVKMVRFIKSSVHLLEIYMQLHIPNMKEIG